MVAFPPISRLIVATTCAVAVGVCAAPGAVIAKPTGRKGPKRAVKTASRKSGSKKAVRKGKSGRPSQQQQSVGSVTAGKLINPTRLRNTKFIKLRFPKNAWGTHRLVSMLDACSRHVRKMHRRSHRLVVGDLSRKKGGRFPPHAGHQNGREADVGFYMRSGRPLKGLWRVGNKDLDLPRNLTFVDCILRSGHVHVLFLDRGLQAGLYRTAKKRGWSKARLHRTFSYPRPKHVRVGQIQHRGGHDNHLHIRIRCAKHERRCRNAVFSRRRATARIRRPRRAPVKRR